ncbi:GerAB/ArcD/ProY family transporter [Paenibacillus flagellatus]|uniref:Spore gernimation protein n=1 Tax=Paenibacillus flagellatus TaxID=2211139 RepID=A0A2V5KCJ6_9BACL|nr:endospore germination permease [Paenibacillus flagellatus]PYI57335.1 spore gernimation protein [Paenibacillus flagellatus]
MIERGKISAFQMAMMLYAMPIVTGVVLLPAITAKHAEQDLWLVPLIASPVGLFLVLIAGRLEALYPNKTVMEYSIDIVGRIPGKALGFVFLFFYLHLGGVVVRQYGEFVVGNFYLRTPMVVIIACTVFVCAVAVRSGLEVVGRCSETFMTLLVAMILAVAALLLPQMKPEHVLPVLERGIGPVVKGAASPMDWFSSFFALFFLYPFIKDKDKGRKWGIISVVAVMLTMIVSNLTALFLFGEITADLTYPLMIAVRQISLAGFIEHVETFVMAIWILGVFVQIAMHYYVVVIGTAQWLGLDEYKTLVFPIGLLLIVLSVWVAPDFQTLSRFLGTSFAFYALTVRLLIPVLLLVIALLRKKREGKRAG